MKASAEILIVGAGPVGLMLAVELLRDGVDVLLIEQMPRRSFFCKALGVKPGPWKFLRISVLRRRQSTRVSG